MATSLSDKVHNWLYVNVLPFWSTTGIDPSGLGAWEALSHDGAPLTTRDKRIRVHPRQAYVFAKAAAHGHPEYLPVAQKLLDYTMQHGMHPETNHLIARTRPNGTTTGRPHELYDLAFVLLAIAALTEAGAPQPDALARAQDALAQLDTPTGWMRNLAGEQPQAQNPYMHLFEASTELLDATNDPVWGDAAARILTLFQQSFHRADGAVLEFFDKDWAPLQIGQRVEPGHIFEWIWLLDQYSRVTNSKLDTDIAQMFSTACDSMTDRGLFTDTLEPHSSTSRLWPQCEALKATIVLEQRELSLPEQVSSDLMVERMFEHYFNTSVPGGWFDKLDATGTVISTDMPSSSLYHIYVALQAYLSHRS